MPFKVLVHKVWVHHFFTSQQGKHDYTFLKQSYDVLSTRYFKVNKTIELISRNFWCSQMWKFVKEFVCIWRTCAWTKPPHHQPNGLLQALTLLKVHGHLSLWTSSHLPPMIQVFWLNPGCCGWLVDKSDKICFDHQRLLHVKVFWNSSLMIYMHVPWLAISNVVFDYGL